MDLASRLPPSPPGNEAWQRLAGGRAPLAPARIGHAPCATPFAVLPREVQYVRPHLSSSINRGACQRIPTGVGSVLATVIGMAEGRRCCMPTPFHRTSDSPRRFECPRPHPPSCVAWPGFPSCDWLQRPPRWRWPLPRRLPRRLCMPHPTALARHARRGNHAH
jgi:hypothetical protein